MRKYLLLIIGWLGLQTASAQEYNYSHLDFQFKEAPTASSSSSHITYKNLRLYPIRAKQSFLEQVKDMGKYTPLREALAKKWVVITEQEGSEPAIQERVNNQIQQTQNQVGGGATVNQLFIENTSQDSIYIMAGEIVQGGKQDRVIAQDVVLAPNQGKIDLSVFCVEKGRWTYGESENKAFDTYYGQGSLTMRGVVDQKQNQQKVWEEVDRSNTANMVQSKTSAYTAQKSSGDFRKQQEEYIAYFNKQFAGEKNVIGVLVATGDRIVGCDMFASPQIFNSQFESLIVAYTSEAITDGAPLQVSEGQVKKYMDQLLANETLQKQFIKEKGKVFENKNRKLRISTY